MVTLGTAITESVIHHYGRAAFLARLSDPFWFQAFGSVLGMDWHSSGITTSVMGALKKGLNPRAHELGIYVCGGRGRHSRNTPQELRALADRTSLDGDSLVRISRLTARIDNNAIADGFQIYLHSFVLTADGDWAVVQQGLNEDSRLARRYHWHSASVRDFTADPHTAIVGQPAGTVMNLVDGRAARAQDALLTIARADPARPSARFAACRCPPGTTCAPPTCTRNASAPCLHSRTNASCATSRPSCCSNSSGRERCSHWRWSPKWCTARRPGSKIPPGSPSPMAARTATRFRSRCASTTNRLRCSGDRSMRQSSATPTSCRG